MRRSSISRKTVLAISFSFGVSLSDPKKFTASVTDIEVTSTTFLRLSTPPFAPRNTLSASLRKRAPPQSSHFSVPRKYFVPRPLQVEQAPYGELKEKSRGSISGKENPSFGQANFADIRNSSAPTATSLAFPPSTSPPLALLDFPATVPFFFFDSGSSPFCSSPNEILTKPSVSRMARSTASERRISVSRGLSVNSWSAISSTRISMLCALCLSSSIRSRRFCKLPSIRTRAKPLPSISYKS